MGDSSLLFMAGANPVEEQRARWERKRSRTAKELLETEHRYLEQLDLVVTVSILVPSGYMGTFRQHALFCVVVVKVKSKTLRHFYCMGQHGAESWGFLLFLFYLLCNIQ